MGNKLLAAFAAFCHFASGGVLLAVPTLTTMQRVACVVVQSMGMALAFAWNLQLPRREVDK
jgi:hypothetical protein